MGKVFHPSDHFCGRPSELLWQVYVFPVLRIPKLDAVVQVRSHKSGVEGENHIPRPDEHRSFYTDQNAENLDEIQTWENHLHPWFLQVCWSDDETELFYLCKVIIYVTYSLGGSKSLEDVW